MDARLFEEEEHASVYQKFRPSLPLEMKNLVLSYLEDKKGKPFGLAVDVGCGSGQSTRMLAPHFQKMVGTDISEAQIKEAKKVLDHPNVSYCVCPAEELPLEAASVDLILASSAVHWFNIEKFLKEVDRVLKPRGCMALICHAPLPEVHAKDCTEKLTAICNEVEEFLQQFATVHFAHIRSGYKEIFDAIPFPDKKRVVDTECVVPMSVADFLGFIQSTAVFQTFLKADSEAATEFLRKTEQRCWETMGASSPEVMLESHLKYACVLASKPS